jgi:glycosyltransferase involved in cell wall biosynthesis
MEVSTLTHVQRCRARGADDRLLVFDTPPGPSALDLDPGDVPVIHVPRRPGLDPAFVAGLRAALARHAPAVVHAHNDTALVYAAVARVGLRARLVGSFHNAPARPTPAARRATRLAAASAEVVTAVSAELAARLVREGWTGRCEPLPNGVDTARFTPDGPGAGLRAALGILASAFVVAHLGRFDLNKRQALLVDAFRHLPRPAALVLVGRGPEREAVERRAAGDPDIHFLPRVADVPGALREVDAVVLCSRHEGSPRAVLEAMATARPVVATAAGGTAELLAGGAGVVVADTPEALASALLALKADPAQARALGAAARARVCAAHDLAGFLEACEEVYARAQLPAL